MEFNFVENLAIADEVLRNPAQTYCRKGLIAFLQEKDVYKRQGDIFFLRVINTYFTAGSYAILALPEFDQPSFVIIRKSNRFAMHDHMEAG